MGSRSNFYANFFQNIIFDHIPTSFNANKEVPYEHVDNKYNDERPLFYFGWSTSSEVLDGCFHR